MYEAHCRTDERDPADVFIFDMLNRGKWEVVVSLSGNVRVGVCSSSRQPGFVVVRTSACPHWWLGLVLGDDKPLFSVWIDRVSLGLFKLVSVRCLSWPSVLVLSCVVSLTVFCYALEGTGLLHVSIFLSIIWHCMLLSHVYVPLHANCMSSAHLLLQRVCGGYVYKEREGRIIGPLFVWYRLWLITQLLRYRKLRCRSKRCHKLRCRKQRCRSKLRCRKQCYQHTRYRWSCCRKKRKIQLR